MDTPPPLADLPPFKDTQTGLTVFGIFEIIGGALCALMIPLAIFSQVAATRQAGHEFEWGLVWPSIAMLGVVAIGAVWLGIGSLMARRWARALWLCLGWMGLCVGVITLAVMVPVLGSLGTTLQQSGQQLPPAALRVATVVAFTSIFVMYVVIPGALVLFYRRENVRRTCEARDPVTRWTDRCPLPVIALCLLQLFGGLSMVVMPRFGAAVPVAGFLVTGWPARLLWLGFAAFSLYAARGFYRLDRHAWWIYTVGILVCWISAAITFLRIDLLDYYRAVGLPEWQLEQLARGPLIRGHLFAWMTVPSIVVYAGYLLYLRRFFPKSAPTASGVQ